MSKRLDGLVPKGGSSYGPEPPPLANPFQKTGRETPYELKETKTSCVMRIDMPGCPDKDLAYWMDSNNVHFFADEPPNADHDHAGRNYGGSMVFNPELYNVKETKAKLVNGVLWITVPKHANKAN